MHRWDPLERVNVDSNNGTVYLNGIVENARAEVERRETGVEAKGVKSVVNNLQIEKRSRGSRGEDRRDRHPRREPRCERNGIHLGRALRGTRQ